MAGKYPVPKGPAANAAKQRYNRNHYETISLVVKKGRRDEIKELAARYGLSVNALINVCIEKQEPKPAGTDKTQSEYGTCPDCGRGLLMAPPCWCAWCGKKLVESG